MKKITNTLIFYAHPKTKGHCNFTLNTIKKYLSNTNETYEIIDLYKNKYDPVLKENELYTIGKRKISKKNKEYQKKIANAKNLIFIYPNWWGSMPAILKGFIDRVFVSGFGFIYKNHIPKGLLTDKKASIIITTGAPKIFFRLFHKSRAEKNMIKDIMKFCGIKAKAYIIDNATQFNTKQEKKIKKTVKKALNNIGIK